MKLLRRVLEWFLGPRGPSPSYSARKQRQRQARIAVNRALRTGEFRR
jgi:hypothetical protein